MLWTLLHRIGIDAACLEIMSSGTECPAVCVSVIRFDACQRDSNGTILHHHHHHHTDLKGIQRAADMAVFADRHMKA